MSEEHIFKPRDQIERIKRTNSKSVYLDLIRWQFEDTDESSFYLGGFKKAVPDSYFRFMSPDYYKFAALLANEVAQNGFVSIEGQLNRHKRKKWQASPFHPRHLLAAACYSASINQQAYPNRVEQQKFLQEQFPEHEPTSFGIWGTSINVKDGVVKPNFWTEPDKKLVNRFLNHRPICLPNPDITNRLVDLGFDGDAAEFMPDQEFMQKVYPKVSEIIGDLMDPRGVFINPQFRRTVTLGTTPVRPKFDSYNVTFTTVVTSDQPSRNFFTSVFPH